jgi:nicotinate phosphoribosyltransferase
VGQRFESLDVRALHEGDEIAPWETVMTIEGDYSEFAHLETVYLGCLRPPHADHAQRARGGRRRARQADPVLPRPPRPLARADRRRLVGAHRGAIGVSTDAQASWWGGRGSAPSRTA